MPVNRMGRTFRWAIPLLLAALVPAGCDDSLTDPPVDAPPEGVATLSVYLTDAPGDVAAVWVDVVDVVLVGEGGPISLLDEPYGLVNLLDLQDRNLLLSEGRAVEAGRYSQVRLIIGGGVLETVGGDVYVQGDVEHPEGLPGTGTLHCPSCSQSGIKVQFSSGLDLQEGANGLLLDFDVAQSFGRLAGQSGRWVMRPLVKGLVADPGEIEDGALGGAIQGTVVLDLGVDPESGEPVELPVCDGAARTLADFYPVATSRTLEDDEGAPIVHVGSTSGEGEFQISVMETDGYDLEYWSEVLLEGATLTWEAEVAPATVEVAEGEVVDGVVFTITGASCQADEDS
jgi:hypothetical protein